MADDATQNQDGQQQSTDPTSGGGDGSKPDQITLTSQQLADRLARAKPADYDDLKAKAARLDEIEAANKSEIEKAAEAQQAAEAERDKAKTEALRFKVASKHGISDEDADLFLTGSDENTLTKQAERLAAHTADAGKPRPPRPDPNQGRNGGPAGGSTADQFAAFADAALKR